MTKLINFFATCPKNLEGLLEEELISFGARKTKQTVAGVEFCGDLKVAYRACLWSRIANRIFYPLDKFLMTDATALYDGVRRIKWLDHLLPSNSLLIDFAGGSETINNSHFGALKVKDAIVDQVRDKTGIRPDVDKEHPDIRINVYLYHDLATVSIDLSGDSLHRRGYRTSPVLAPIKENLAAAILYRSNWVKFAQEGKPLFDPMCGSGTILIEAVMMAQDYAPNLMRQSFGFSKWLGHDKALWELLVEEAKERQLQGAQKFKSSVCGCDIDVKAIDVANLHIKNAGLERFINVEVNPVKKIKPPKYCQDQFGIIVTNPPYGKRLNEIENLSDVYRDFGVALRENFLNWNMAMLTGDPELGKTLGVRSYKQYNFFNGTIPCKLLLFHIIPSMFWREYKGKNELTY